jgi:hypothetical protein
VSEVSIHPNAIWAYTEREHERLAEGEYLNPLDRIPNAYAALADLARDADAIAATVCGGGEK